MRNDPRSVSQFRGIRFLFGFRRDMRHPRVTLRQIIITFVVRALLRILHQQSAVGRSQVEPSRAKYR